ncbi:MAG: efflux RND transporter periplasmic adaptor subunit [Planctomycetes bacterium]|nr:efflux RND transporter periplasmic adaptor subunit [Planctomycetota bacterium]
MPSSTTADLTKLRIPGDSREALFQRRSSPLPWVFALLLLGGGGAAGWWYWKTVLSVPEVSTSRVVLVTPTEGNAVLTASGYVVAQRKVILGAKSPRRLVERMVSEGESVRANQVVARLDHRDVDARLEQARAALAAADAAIERAKMAITRAERDFEESKAKVVEAEARRDGDAREVRRYLEAEKSGAAVRKERELAETALAISTAALESARKRAASAEASVDWYRKDLGATQADRKLREADIEVALSAVEDTEVRAPFDGVVLLKQAEIGESVSPGVVSGQVTSGSIFQIADFNSLEAEVDVNESGLAKVRDGQPASIQVDAIPDRMFAGRVRMLMPGANRQKATVAAKVEFLEKDSRLKPDLGCKVTFLREAAQSQGAPKLLAPARAVVRRGSEAFAFLVRDGQARRQAVDAGEPQGDRVEIRSGLREGDTVILSPPADLRDGSPIRQK